MVDDGSTDGHPCAFGGVRRAQPWRDPRHLQEERRPRLGRERRPWPEARGRYFRVVDGDDWVNTDGMAELLERLADLDCDLVVDKKREIDMTSGEERPFPLAKGVVTGRALDFSSVLTNGDTVFQIMIHTLTARTDYLRGIGISLLEHTFYEDYEYVVKASVPASTICYLDIEVYQYLVGNENQSVSQANYVRRWDDHDRVVMELLDYLERCEHGEVCAASGERLSDESVYYVREKVHLIVDTHYNIALLFDEDRSRGRARAKAFPTRVEVCEHRPVGARRAAIPYGHAPQPLELLVQLHQALGLQAPSLTRYQGMIHEPQTAHSHIQRRRQAWP